MNKQLTDLGFQEVEPNLFRRDLYGTMAQVEIDLTEDKPQMKVTSDHYECDPKKAYDDLKLLLLAYDEVREFYITQYAQYKADVYKQGDAVKIRGIRDDQP